jgi:ribose transport system substrate-binding protein
MRSHQIRPQAGLASFAVIAVFVVAGCGSSKHSAISSTTSASTQSASTSAPAPSTTLSAPSASGPVPVSNATGAASSAIPSGIAAAQAAIAPYEGHPSVFPATEKLEKRPPAGSQFIYLQCSTPICALIGQLLVAPTKALGVGLTVINSGGTATSSQAAAAAALAKKPAAVLLPAVDAQEFGQTLHQLGAAGIAVTGVGIIGGAPYGVQETVGGDAGTALAGQLLADWVAAKKGAQANVVFFGVPELSFSAPMQTNFQSTLAQACPSCSVSFQKISVTTFGTTAPATVVSYLQAHPTVNTVVFASMEAATGLAAALKVANKNVTTIGFAPSPSNLQDIMTGGLTAGLGLDLPVQEWMQVNVTARLLAHQTTTASDLSADLEFLTKDDVTTADTTHGWTGYLDVAQRFAALWPTS